MSIQRHSRQAYFTRFIAFCAVVSFCAILMPLSGDAQETVLTHDELQEQIRLQNERLENINKELEKTKENLEETQSQRQSLQRDLNNIDYSVTKLNLNIRAGEITTSKLAYELDSLEYDIRSIELSIETKHKALQDLLREIQKNDGRNLLLLFLENESLAESLSDAESLGSVRAQLDVDIANLKQFSELYQGKLGEVSSKKTQADLEQQNLKYRKLILEDQKQERATLLSATRNQESEYQKKLRELQDEQLAISDEITKIEDQLRAAFDPTLLPTKRPGVFGWPLTNVRVTQHFGERSSLYRGKPHNGMDLGASVGTPVFAAEDGVVFAIGNNDVSRWAKYQYGKFIMIQHPNNLSTLYAHLSRQIVSQGQTVKRGELIGYSGSTGYSTGPHLHFGLYWTPSVTLKKIPPAAGLVPVGVIIDPEDYL